MELADDAFREVYNLITEAYGEDQRVAGNDTAAHFDIQLEKPAKWFLRLDAGNPEHIYLVFRVSPVKAKDLGLEVKPCAAGAGTCMVEITGVDDLQPLKSLILAAYHAVSVSTGILDPADVPADLKAPPTRS